MPNLREHLKASKTLLGTTNPLVHRLIDLPSPKKEHRYRHTPETIGLITGLLATDQYEKQAIKREAWLHLLMDWNIVGEKDYKG